METRPSKKQSELLNFIDGFIKTNGYGPSYREVMRALDYKSVSTVAVHVDGLIARGLLRKRDHSARSLEVVSAQSLKDERDGHFSWLQIEIDKRDPETEDAAVLRKALEVLQGKKMLQ